MAKADRVGKRKTRDRFQTRIPDLGYYFIVTDTKETEENYVNGLRDALPERVKGRMIIRVSRVKTGNLVTFCREMAAMEPQYGEPWIIFDRDRVQDFDGIIEQAEREHIHVGWSNPCIEIWFDAYFGKMHSYPDSVICCREFAADFERRTGQEYKKSNRSIYRILNRFGDEREAVKTARLWHERFLREGNQRPSEMCPCTTLYLFVEEIRNKIKNS